MSTSAITCEVIIARDPDAVYAFASNVENLPQWAAGLCRSVRRQGSDWLVETSEGALLLRMSPANPHRILDHTVTLPSGVEVHVPMRVLATPDGRSSNVLLTLFRQPDMTDADFARDRAAVERDLLVLKHILERSR